MALNGLFSADVLLRNYSLTQAIDILPQNVTRLKVIVCACDSRGLQALNSAVSDVVLFRIILAYYCSILCYYMLQVFASSKTNGIGCAADVDTVLVASSVDGSNVSDVDNGSDSVNSNSASVNSVDISR